MKTIEENNVLIAEFMGAKIIMFKGREYLEWFGNGGIFEDAYKSDMCLFNISWDWLMLVVEKIEKLGYGVTIGMGVYCVIQNDMSKRNEVVVDNDTLYLGIWREDLKEIVSMTDNNKLFCTFNAVVEFIKWYNENK